MQPDRRGSPRRRRGGRAVFYQAARESPSWWAAELRDLSTEGAALLLCLPYAPGTVLTLDLPGLRRHVRARVVRACPHPTAWVHGCRLEQPLTDAEVRAACLGPAPA